MFIPYCKDSRDQVIAGQTTKSGLQVLFAIAGLNATAVMASTQSSSILATLSYFNVSYSPLAIIMVSLYPFSGLH